MKWNRGKLLGVIACLLIWLGLYMAYCQLSFAGVRSSDPRAYVALATAQYPGNPCVAGAQLTVTDELTAPNRLGEAFVEACEYRVRPGLTPELACSTVVHELGHLAGLGHDDSHPNVMNTEAGFIYPACAAYTRPSTSQQAARVAHVLGSFDEQRTRCVRTKTRGWRCRDGMRMGYAMPDGSGWAWVRR